MTYSYSSRRPNPLSENHLACCPVHPALTETPTLTKETIAMNLRYEIEQAINRCSAESGSNTPDFILAEYLVDCLNAFDKAVKARTAWYTDDEPGILAAGALADAALLNQEGDRP